MQPEGIGLFKVYCGIMTAIYAVLALGALIVPLLGLDLRTEDTITFLAMGLISFPFMLVFAYALFLPRAKWAWIFGMALIALGLSSCCFWPICIPLLIKWIDPKTKAWFEQSEAATLGQDGW